MWYAVLIILIVLCIVAIYFLFLSLLNEKKEYRIVLNEMAKQKQLSGELTKISEELTEKSKDVSKHLEESQKNLIDMGKKYLKENINIIMNKLTPNNYATSHKQLERIIEFCEKKNLEVPKEEKARLFNELKEEYKVVVRKDIQKQEQQRIKELIREEERLEREREREIKHLENEQLAIEKALQTALKKAKDEHDVEVERLRKLLEEAEEKAQRAKSQAQLTKAGHIYVISNIGSFGNDVFKVGMTRRLEPIDRVRELGDASVPFPFDVHMMISCEDAPKLENELHKEMYKLRINKVNNRKEFYRVNVEKIKQLVEKYYGTVDYVAEPEAFEYYESKNMSEEDDNFVTEQLQEVESKLTNEAIDQTLKKIEKEKTEAQNNVVGKTVPCPLCKKPLDMKKIVIGRNQCHHCQKYFVAKSKKA